jgi:hypothetical protein
VKNQYFGDVRDLFKYDLMFWLIRNIECIESFTFIPMLTEPDDTGDGGKIDHHLAKAGFNNEELISFLENSVSKGNRNIKEIARYFESLGTQTVVYKEAEYFDHKNRQRYFSSIDDSLLRSALIFLDPDNGMEVKKSNRRHVLLGEISDLYRRMDSHSLLMVYQHFPRRQRSEYLYERLKELFDISGIPPVCIHDKEISFFFLAKTKGLMKSLGAALQGYAGLYPLLELGSIDALRWKPSQPIPYP